MYSRIETQRSSELAIWTVYKNILKNNSTEIYFLSDQISRPMVVKVILSSVKKTGKKLF